MKTLVKKQLQSQKPKFEVVKGFQRTGVSPAFKSRDLALKWISENFEYELSKLSTYPCGKNHIVQYGKGVTPYEILQK